MTRSGLTRWRPALALIAAAFAFFGQYLLSNAKSMVNDGLILYAIGVAAFLPLAFGRYPYGRDDKPPVDSGKDSLFGAALRSPFRTSAVILAFGLAYLTLRLVQGKSGVVSYLDAVVFWMAAIVTITSAFIPAKIVRRPRLRTWFAGHRYELLVLTALTAAAGALRFVALGSIPEIVVGDEGRIGALGSGGR